MRILNYGAISHVILFSYLWKSNIYNNLENRSHIIDNMWSIFSFINYKIAFFNNSLKKF